jgi:hypothetical protein
MRYIVIDASLNGTGVRDKFEGGYISLEEMGISNSLKAKINIWLLKYEKEFYLSYSNKLLIEVLDKEGQEIAQQIKIELENIKVEYFSDAKMTGKLI